MIKNAKVAVVGGRDYEDYQTLCSVLDYYNDKYGISIIVSGGATGADTLAEKYAHSRQIDLHVFMAYWNKEGKRAGPRRNLRIVEYCDLMIAFPTKDSKGTYNAISLAKKLNKPVYVYKEGE